MKMDMRWSLDELYSSFDSPEFTADMDKADKLIEGFSAWAKENLESRENAGEKIEHYISSDIELTNVLTRLMTFSHLSSSVDARNEAALKAIDKLQKKFNELTEPSVRFQKWLASLDDLDGTIESSPLLKKHSYYLKRLVETARYLLSEELEAVIAKMTSSGSKAWTRLQNTLVSTLLVDMEEGGQHKQLPLPVVRNMAYDGSADLRKRAYEAELKAYEKIEQASAACLNGIKGEVITVAELRGYSSPLDETLVKSRLDQEALNAMLDAMKESLPDFRRYYRKKADLLGYKNGLPFYDLFAPLGKADMKFTYEEARDYIVASFRSFSDKLADFAYNAFEKRWIDAEPRDGKRGGAFCSNIHPIGESRILANFNGSFSNVTTLAHELGHGYHGSCLMDESILNSRYPMPIAETASIFCETIVMDAALKEADPEQALGLLETSVSDAGQVIVDIYSRFLFESRVFELRRDHALSVNELKDLMIEAQKEAYGDGLDPDHLHPYMWINKSHYYSASLSFYNFPYAFGLLFAKGVYAEYLKRGRDFVPEYDRLLRSTGKNDIADVAAMVGIDIHSIDFWRSSLDLVRRDIDRFIELAGR